MKKTLILSLILSLSIAGCSLNSENEETYTINSEIQEKSQANSPEETSEIESDETTYQFEGDLTDVTGSQTIREINTQGLSMGIAKSKYENSQYDLIAEFDNLPDPAGTDFYEGWIVRQGSNLSVISTGKASKEGDKYINTFDTEEDLSDHLFYVLTLEPDDGDPTPAEHILEGTLTKIQ